MKINRKSKKKKALSSIFTAVSIVLLIVFASFGTIQSFNQISEIQSEIDQTYDNLPFDEANIFSDNFSHNPCHLPSDPNPFKEDKDEKDNVDEKEWSKSYSLRNTFVKSISNSEYAERAIKQFEQSIANRTKISLFVLHHSWKTYLT